MSRSFPLLVLALLLAAPASAQQYRQDARAAVAFPSMLGRGDAGVALPSRETSFFVNPAHVAATSGRFHFSLGGLAAGMTPSALDVGRRVRDEADGYEDYDEVCDTDGDGVPDDVCSGDGTSTGDLAAEIVSMTRRPAELRGAVLLPSVSFRAGRFGVSAGAFVHSTARVQSARTAAGDSVHAFGQADGIGAVTVSAALPAGLSAGVGARYVRRFATVYDLDPGALDALDDPALVEGSTVAVDVGVLWATPVRGLAAGLAVYDLGGAMSYAPSDFYGLLGTGGTEVEARRVAAALSGRDGRPSFRLGAAYRPALPPGAPVGLALAADYVSASTAAYEPSPLQHLRLGAEATLGRVLAARAGLGGGGPSVGATLNLVAFKLDYALYTQPTGRVAGEDGGFRHALLVRLGLD